MAMANPERVLRVRVTASDAPTLRALLREEHLDTGGRPHVGGDGTVAIDAYVPESRTSALEREGVTVRVVEDASATGRARQAEVGRGNRFAAPDAVPRGLGRKIQD
jgi:hypothetical protein